VRFHYIRWLLSDWRCGFARGGGVVSIMCACISGWSAPITWHLQEGGRRLQNVVKGVTHAVRTKENVISATVAVLDWIVVRYTFYWAAGKCDWTQNCCLQMTGGSSGRESSGNVKYLAARTAGFFCWKEWMCCSSTAICCCDTAPLLHHGLFHYIYRVFHNVLRDYKQL
jgi:hypothetical protein